MGGVVAYDCKAPSWPSAEDNRGLCTLSDTLLDRQTKQTSVMIVDKGDAAGGPPADDARRLPLAVLQSPVLPIRKRIL